MTALTPEVLEKQAFLRRMYNCGTGDAVQRMSNVLWRMQHDANCVTRQVCRQTVAHHLIAQLPLEGGNG